MAITSAGYDGVLDEVSWSRMQVGVGADPYGVDSNGVDLSITNSTVPKVTVSAGSLFGFGVYDTIDAATDVTIVNPPTTTGQTRWDSIVMRRTWATNTSTLVAVGGNANPLPSTNLLNNPGVSADQLLALARVVAGQAKVQEILDFRLYPYKPIWTLAATPPDPNMFGYGQQLVMADYGHTLVRRGSTSLVPSTAFWFNLDDPPWSNLNIGGGMVAGTSVPRYRVRRGQVELTGNGRRAPTSNGGIWSSTAAQGNQEVLVGTLPSTHAPEWQHTYSAGIENGMGGRARAYVTTAGQIYVTLLGGDQFGGLYYDCFNFPVKAGY